MKVQSPVCTISDPAGFYSDLAQARKKTDPDPTLTKSGFGSDLHEIRIRIPPSRNPDPIQGGTTRIRIRNRPDKIHPKLVI